MGGLDFRIGGRVNSGTILGFFQNRNGFGKNWGLPKRRSGKFLPFEEELGGPLSLKGLGGELGSYSKIGWGFEREVWREWGKFQFPIIFKIPIKLQLLGIGRIDWTPHLNLILEDWELPNI